MKHGTLRRTIDAELVGLVHQCRWRSPEPAARYDLVVIGGGTAGR